MSEQVHGKPAVTRNTLQRDVVLEAVYALGGTHPTSSDVLAEAKKRHSGISRATVYRNLDVLAEDGKILRIEMTQGPTRYDHTLTPHSHAVCRICGKVVDVDIAHLGTGPEHLAGNGPEDFRIERYHLIFEGICDGCSGS